MDIAIIAQEKINKFVTDGTLDTLIENQIKKTLESTVNDLFRDYSDFGKDLKDTIKKKLKVNLDEISIPIYTNTICKVIEDVLVSTSLEPSIKKIRETVEQCINQSEKKVWKLSEIIRKYVENGYRGKDAIYEVGEAEYSSQWVKIGTPGNNNDYTSRGNYDLKMLVDVKTKVISNVWFEGKQLTGITVSKEWGFSGFLMGLWMNECFLEVDDDDTLDEACIRENECHC